MAQPHVIVLFGATGDLARRKLLPGLLRLFEAGLLDNSMTVGTSREEIDSEGFVKLARDACEEFGKGVVTDQRWAPFAELLAYVPTSHGAHALADQVRDAEKRPRGGPTRPGTRRRGSGARRSACTTCRSRRRRRSTSSTSSTRPGSSSGRG